MKTEERCRLALEPDTEFYSPHRHTLPCADEVLNLLFGIPGVVMFSARKFILCDKEWMHSSFCVQAPERSK